MDAQKYPFAIRLIGFDAEDSAHIGGLLELAPAAGPSYFCLLDESLQEPDFYIANGEDLKSLARLAALNPGPLQPALLVGVAPVELPFPRMARPFAAAQLYRLLAELVDERADAMAGITARGLPSVPERRRRERLDFDLTDPGEYEKMRRAPPTGAVLIVDRGCALRDHVVQLLSPRKLSIEWTDSAPMAVRLCDETPVSLVLINTSTPGIDPYALCGAIKALAGATRIAVVLLVGGSFAFDSARARSAGIRGVLDKPVADRHLSAALKKLLSLPT
ncbi:MAG: response regulator [Pseudomonadota bacterium]